MTELETRSSSLWQSRSVLLTVQPQGQERGACSLDRLTFSVLNKNNQGQSLSSSFFVPHKNSSHSNFILTFCLPSPHPSPAQLQTLGFSLPLAQLFLFLYRNLIVMPALFPPDLSTAHCQMSRRAQVAAGLAGQTWRPWGIPGRVLEYSTAGLMSPPPSSSGGPLPPPTISNPLSQGAVRV